VENSAEKSGRLGKKKGVGWKSENAHREHRGRYEFSLLSGGEGESRLKGKKQSVYSGSAKAERISARDSRSSNRLVGVGESKVAGGCVSVWKQTNRQISTQKKHKNFFRYQ